MSDDLIEHHFTLRIHVRTGHFGSTEHAERCGIAYLLQQAAQKIQSSAPDSAPSAHLVDSGGHVIGDYSFGVGMLCGPGPGFDQTHVNLQPGDKITGAARARRA